MPSGAVTPLAHVLEGGEHGSRKKVSVLPLCAGRHPRLAAALVRVPVRRKRGFLGLDELDHHRETHLADDRDCHVSRCGGPDASPDALSLASPHVELPCGGGVVHLSGRGRHAPCPQGGSAVAPALERVGEVERPISGEPDRPSRDLSPQERVDLHGWRSPAGVEGDPYHAGPEAVCGQPHGPTGEVPRAS